MPLTIILIYFGLVALRYFYDITTPEVSGGFFMGWGYALAKTIFASMAAFGFIRFNFRSTLWQWYYYKAGDKTPMHHDWVISDSQPKRLWRFVIFYTVWLSVFFSVLAVKIG
jgi:hypothetical protein